MSERESLCVRVTTLLRNKYTSLLRVVSSGSTCHNSQDFYFNVLDIGLVLNTAQVKIDIALTITLVRTS